MKYYQDKNYINGYIEGFYGKLLDWESRKLIISALNKNKMNTYLYAPKEDKNHRFHWRKKYSPQWRKSFRDFTNFSKEKKIEIIAGIAPGLDFDFNVLKNNPKSSKRSDISLLFNKAKQLLNDGASAIALLMDDIQDDFTKIYGKDVSEGSYHGDLANELSKMLGQSIYFVPRIYADELIYDSPKYLLDLSKTLNIDTKIFYCGKDVICKTITNYSKIHKLFSNKIIYWDNFYANDYCPRRFFIGPYVGRVGINNLMINPTGLINTDLLIIDIIANTKDLKNPNKVWLKILKKHGVPDYFKNLKKFFLSPSFGKNPTMPSYKENKKYHIVLELLLWSWKGQLSREWYPYLFGLKNDMEINQRKLMPERLIKTQTIPLAQHINKI
jgi:hypothetical protein